MSTLSSITSSSSPIIGRIGPRGVESRISQTAAASAPADQVEISASALNAARSAQQADQSTFEQARQARINTVRQQIQDGTYDLDEKATIVADRLARALRSI
jgi:anti-sigma28 factor (negative regulator of flagellin synthesis)